MNPLRVNMKRFSEAFFIDYLQNRWPKMTFE